MTTHKELSEHIDRIARLHKTSRVARVWYRLCFKLLRYLNEPFRFRWVQDEGAAVGEPIGVFHLTLHDMMPHAVDGALTNKVLLHGMRVNAVQEIGFERISDMTGVTTVQPRWV